MKGQMLPLICLHNSPRSSRWLIPTQGLPACHPVTRVFYSRWSEQNKRTESGPTFPGAQGSTRLCIKQTLVVHCIHWQSPVHNHFYVEGPGPTLDLLMLRTRCRVCPSHKGQGACQCGDICSHKTRCRGRVEIAGGENWTNLWWNWKVREDKGFKCTSQHTKR